MSFLDIRSEVESESINPYVVICSLSWIGRTIGGMTCHFSDSSN